ncbi:MAG: hypothetical protein JSU57_05255 [Candidatus Heimdallarchaeota archaeon]|nr:MAG: hypothetical protein JSU57_05255 [Candidatus Heimdallarchaeota archaeon]
MTQEDYLIELQEINNIAVNDPKQLTSNNKKRFWQIVGVIKREISPDPQLVDLAVEIREILYLQRLGSTKPMGIVIPIWTVCGIAAIVCPLLFTFSELIYVAMIISWSFVAIFMLGYLWIVNMDRKWFFVIFIAAVGGTVVGDLIIAMMSIELLVEFNRFLMFAAIPCFYLHGRYIGGLIAGIQFDGVSRDVFHFPTLKINYRSYLLAQPPARQWIFFCGGIGTVVTSVVVATVQLFVFGDIFWNLIPILLFLGDLSLAGPLSRGEFSHLLTFF